MRACLAWRHLWPAPGHPDVGQTHRFMKSRYIEVFFGTPHLTEALRDYSPNRLAVMQRTWEHVHAFDEHHRYQLEIPEIPRYGPVSKIMAHVGYNPQEHIASKWIIAGDCKLSDIVNLVKCGLESDDDSIQQWFGAESIIKLLHSAKNWSEMLIAVDAITGGHEVNIKTLDYVNSIL